MWYLFKLCFPSLKNHVLAVTILYCPCSRYHVMSSRYHVCIVSCHYQVLYCPFAIMYCLVTIRYCIVMLLHDMLCPVAICIVTPLHISLIQYFVLLLSSIVFVICTMDCNCSNCVVH